MNNEKLTCSDLFNQCLESLKEDLNENLTTYSLGFMVGQAEKIYLKACDAAMFCPKTDDFDVFFNAIHKISKIYGLKYGICANFQDKIEIWLLHPSASDVFHIMMSLPENTPQKHILRGLLCGIPIENIDIKFHLRYES